VTDIAMPHDSAPQASTALERNERLRQVIEAGVALNAQLSLGELLALIARTAAELTGARYAALGVLDRTGESLAQFIVHGVDEATRRELGEYPRGRGILGVLIHDATPLRLTDLREDPRSVGFPPGHPPMTSFLGVPVRLRAQVYGNLYLCDKEGGSFTEEDEELVVLLAAQAAVAIENARLYESMTGWLRQLESLGEVTSALLGEMDTDSVLNLIVSRARELVGARLVALMLPDDDDRLVIAAAAGDDAESVVGMVTARDGSKAGKVMGRRRGERIDSVLEDPEFDRASVRSLGTAAAIFHPLVVRDNVLGVLAVYDRLGPDHRFTDADFRVTEAFASRAALALELSQRVMRDAVRRIVHAQEAERARFARELHDETGQALTSILLGLRPLERELGVEAVAPVRELVQQALRDVRRLAVALRPSVLDDFGLIPAVERMLGDLEENGIAAHMTTRGLDERLPGDIETAVYRIVQEAVTNVKKHAGASTATIELELDGRIVRASVEDDGDGFEAETVEEGTLGLAGMRERAALLGGTVHVESRPGGGTIIVAELPLPVRMA
jgi:signal transduction histidine kinase